MLFSTSTSLTVTGLTEGSEYNVKVKAPFPLNGDTSNARIENALTYTRNVGKYAST